MNSERAASILGKTRLFEDLGDEALVRIAERCVDRLYKKGQVVFHQGDAGEALCVLVEGLVKVGVASPEGAEVLLVTLRPPDTFGELALIDGGPRSASVEAVERTRLLVLTRSTLLELLREYPELVDALLGSLGATIRRVTEQTADLVFLDLHGRVAKLLVTLADARGRPDEKGVALDLHLTQTDLASMVGGSRQSVNQILKSFEGRGYLELLGRTIVLKQPESLRRRAGL